MIVPCAGLGRAEIAVLGTNGAVIAAGDVTPTMTDGEDFGSNRVTVGNLGIPSR
jgi:hypothetical protein